MSYKVIQFFTDLQDFNHPYNVGDEFPRDGLRVSEARIKELSTKANKQGKPIIVASVETDEKEQPRYSKTEINRMPVDELRNLAKQVGIDKAEELTGGELKKNLIDFYHL